MYKPYLGVGSSEINLDYMGNRRQINPYKLNVVQPGIFEVVQDTKTKEFSLKFVNEKYKVPDRIFGNLNYYINYYWRAFERRKFRSGLLLTGSQGAGKSETAKVLCNRALAIGFRVIQLTNVKYSPELITFLESLETIVFFFDEFSKTFQYQTQEKMLTLLSNALNRERIVIITENNKFSISEFIRNRPGRLRYSKHFEKLDITVLEDYLGYMNINAEFQEDLIDLYKRMTVFTFDHLSAIVEEHIDVPELKFKDIIDVLNLDQFTAKKVFVLKSIEVINETSKFKDSIILLDKSNISPVKYSINSMDNGASLVVNIVGKLKDAEEESTLVTLNLNKTYMTTLMGDEIEFKTTDFKLVFDIKENEITGSGTGGSDENRFGRRQPNFFN